MDTSKYPNYILVLLILRYVVVRLVVGSLSLMKTVVVRTVLICDGLLGLVTSPTISGRDQGEFQDLVQPDAPEHEVLRRGRSGDFWKLYFQVYNPRLWRMRRLFPMAAGRRLKRREESGEGN
jgi:hypothetical protein